MTLRKSVLIAAIFSLFVTACGLKGDADTDFPVDNEERLKQRVGKLTGENGLVIGGGEEKGDKGNNPLGVNSFLWRATLDTLAFMPLASADPFGGVVLTDWYEDPKARGERFKVNALILDRQLRADSIKVRMFKQKRDDNTKQWSDQSVEDATNRQLEDAILTRARQLRVAQLGY